MKKIIFVLFLFSNLSLSSQIKGKFNLEKFNDYFINSIKKSNRFYINGHFVLDIFQNQETYVLEYIYNNFEFCYSYEKGIRSYKIDNVYHEIINKECSINSFAKKIYSNCKKEKRFCNTNQKLDKSYTYDPPRFKIFLKSDLTYDLEAFYTYMESIYFKRDDEIIKNHLVEVQQFFD